MAAITVEQRAELVALFLTMFGQAPTTAQLARMVTARENGTSLQNIATSASTILADDYALVASMDADSFATYLTNALLASDTPAEARTWATNWVVTQVSGTKSKAQVITEAVQAIRATDNPNYETAKAELAADVTLALAPIDNPVVVPPSYDLTINQDNLIGTAGNDIFTAGVNTAANGTTLVDTLQAIDQINGGDGVDTLTATINSGAAVIAPTLTSVENVTIRSTAAGSGLSLTGATGVQKVTVANSTATAAVNAVGAVATLAVADQKTNVAFDGQTATTLALALDNVGVNGAPGTAVQVKVDLGATIASAATTLNITANSSNVEVLDSTGANVATAATIAATGSNTLKLTDGANIASLTVTGAGSVNVSSVDLVKGATLNVGDGGITFTTGVSTATSFTATTGAGKDSLTVDGAVVKTITTGAGNDSVTTATAALAATASIDLGAGDDTLTLHAAPAGAGVTLSGGDGKDTLAVTAAGFTSISGYGPTDLAKITGFEILSLTDANVPDKTSVDLSKIGGLTGFQSKGVATGGTATVTNVGANADIILKGDLKTNNGALTVTLKDATGTADVVNLTLNTTITQNNDATVDTTAATVTTTIAGVETLNVNSTGSLSTQVTTGNKTDIAVNTLVLTDADLTTLTVTGDQALSFTSSAAMVKLATIDASAAKAGLTFNADGFGSR
jgi:hypothetical protein